MNKIQLLDVVMSNKQGLVPGRRVIPRKPMASLNQALY